MNLLTIIAYLVAALQKYGPTLAAAVAAYDAGGWAGLEKYLLGLVANPPAGAAAGEMDKVLDKVRTLRGAKAAAAAPTCCPSDGCSCCLECAKQRAVDTLVAISAAQCCDDCPK